MPLRAHHLNAAVIRRLRMRGQHLHCHVVVLETPTSGLVLLDTGLGTADYADISSRLGAEFARGYAHPLVDPDLAVINQLRRAGYAAEEVRHIVMTHLDLDHVGGLSDFPHATVHVLEDELRAATERRTFRDKRRYRPPMWAHGPHWQTYAAAGGEGWFGFEAVRELAGLPSEILLIPLPGHTLGHCGIAFESTKGWQLAGGDAFFDPREIYRPTRECAPMVRIFERLVATDKEQRDHNQDRLRELVRTHPEVSVFSGHDPSWHPERFGMGAR